MVFVTDEIYHPRAVIWPNLWAAASQGIGSMKFLSIALSAVSAIALTACGGGGGDTPAATSSPAVPASAEGVYGGTLTGAASSAFQLLILETGEYWAIYGSSTPSAFSTAGFIQGLGTSSNGTFTSANGKDFGFAPAVAGTISSTYNANTKTITGTTSSSSGTVSFSGGPIANSNYNYNTPASLSTISGSWATSSLTGQGISLNIGSDGAFSALSSAGCRFSGSITPRASGKNVFNVSFTFGAAPCEIPGQAATGIALAYPLANGKTQLLVTAYENTRTYGAAIFGTR